MSSKLLHSGDFQCIDSRLLHRDANYITGLRDIQSMVSVVNPSPRCMVAFTPAQRVVMITCYVVFPMALVLFPMVFVVFPLVFVLFQRGQRLTKYCRILGSDGDHRSHAVRFVRGGYVLVLLNYLLQCVAFGARLLLVLKRLQLFLSSWIRRLRLLWFVVSKFERFERLLVKIYISSIQLSRHLNRIDLCRSISKDHFSNKFLIWE